MPPPSPATLRLFLALWPAAGVRDALDAQAREWTWPPAARRTPPERLHATLHFLGPVAADRVADLREALDVAWPGCELVLDTVQVWPGGIAVLEASRVPAELAALHAALARRLQAQGITVEERRYRPHVTFARKAFGARPPEQLAALHWRIGPQYLLVESRPGGRYEPVASFG